MRCHWILAQPRFSKSIWHSFGTVRPKMTTRIRSKVGKCFRMNKAVIVGAERSLVARLPWAQEVSGSNPDAPTNLFCDLQASLKNPSPHYGGNSGDLLHHPQLFLFLLHLHHSFLHLHHTILL